ncbi:LAME_0D00980g1_1 [Lachancea meyersii CBS 8951]|uniref:LAME_0D00980g1_1 n=1 Tax=Lachancea meyersii CBS 8951 TaxID=1266667 RepID=A0A1G4J670_9SACH|nr:LAME_0D00980g1_1 [Lachancea meyersii CBS 8951]
MEAPDSVPPIHRTVSDSVLLSTHEPPKMLETGSTISELPLDIDMNKLERGELSFDNWTIDENSPLSLQPMASNYNSIALDDTRSAPAAHPQAQRSISAPVEMPGQSFLEPSRTNNGIQNSGQGANNGTSMSFLTTWLWRLYYSNRAVFYGVIGFIIIATTLYTAFTGEGSKYYVVILRASTCYVLGTDRAQSVFGKTFCDFGEHRN